MTKPFTDQEWAQLRAETRSHEPFETISMSRETWLALLERLKAAEQLVTWKCVCHKDKHTCARNEAFDYWRKVAGR